MAILHFRCKERRRTLRVMLTVPLKVRGVSANGSPFSVETNSHTVSLHGALIELSVMVSIALSAFASPKVNLAILFLLLCGALFSLHRFQ